MPPSNNHTVTVADAHSHSIAQAGVEATILTAKTAGGVDSANVPMSGKLDAARNVLDQLASRPDALAAFTDSDTLTITVTQP